MHLARIAVALGSLALTGALVVSIPSCSDQGEGERCDRANGDGDCEDGLICKSKKDLGTSSDICCPPAIENTSDLACLGGLADAGTGGFGGSGTGTGTGSGTGTGTGGAGGSSTGGSGTGGAGGSTSNGGAGGSTSNGGAGGSTSNGGGGAGGG